MDKLKLAKKNFYKIDDTFSNYATKSNEAIRLKDEEDDIRTPFFRDVDRIIHLVIQDILIRLKYILLKEMIIYLKEWFMFNWLVKQLELLVEA